MEILTLVLPNIPSLNFSPLREFLAKEWPKIKRSKWVDIFKDRRDERIVWRTINDSWKLCYFMGLAYDKERMFTP
ncbi:hypothetical protein GQ457_03G022650 [Hibiscus cannabinus]